MDADDRLRLDYEQTTAMLRALTDIRFKLLAIVPTVAGAAVGLLGSPRSAAELLGVGVLGLVATVGLLVYELRNTEISEEMATHAEALEESLGLAGTGARGGPHALARMAAGR